MNVQPQTQLPKPPPGREGWPWTGEAPAVPVTMEDGRPWPRISIITPSYNQGNYLEETIRSVLLQGYPNLEYIIMDGGSTDGSVSILRHYEGFLAHLAIEKDEGQASAIAKGFGLASGEILAWLNSDDLYLSGTLFRVGKFFSQQQGQVFVTGDVQVIDEHSRPTGLVWAITPNVFLTSNSGAHGWPQPGVFFRREAYEAAGGLDESLQFCMDRDLFIRICRQGRAAALWGPPVAAFRQHQAQKSQTIVGKSLEENAILLERYGQRGLRLLRPILKMSWKLWARLDRLNRWIFHGLFT